jgi:two-component system chemotaxis response regulator CheB
MNSSPRSKIKVLVVDDSAVVRKMITDSLVRDPAIEVVGTAVDPYVARDKIKELNPDVLTLDIEMPRMDGLTFLKLLQQHRPMPVIVISSITAAGSKLALDCLAAGAVDVLAKPTSAYSIGALGEQLAQRVKAAAGSSFRRPAVIAPAPVVSAPTPRRQVGHTNSRQLIVLGASTGGTEALASVLREWPDGLPPIAITQHIPAYFSKAFAERLNGICAFEVREAVEGDLLRPGLALVAPGDFHMMVAWGGDGYRVSLNQRPPVHHCRPAVDILFHSAASCAGRNAVAAIFTGMGTDGALGMQKLHSTGAYTLAQDEATCVVYGMPRAAVQLGVVDEVLPLSEMGNGILNALQRGPRITASACAN